MTRSALPILVVLAVLFVAHAADAAEFDTRIPLQRAASGNFYVDGVLNGDVNASFLVDTGSGLVTITPQLFETLAASGKVAPAGRVAARLANGKLQALQLYRVEHFSVGQGCDLGPVEVAVMPGRSTNILGLNLLARAAPFAFHVTPPALALSGCAAPAVPLAAAGLAAR